MTNEEIIDFDMDPNEEDHVHDIYDSRVIQSQVHTASILGWIKSIQFSAEDKERLHSPWKYSLIIKLLGKRIAHHNL